VGQPPLRQRCSLRPARSGGFPAARSAGWLLGAFLLLAAPAAHAHGDDQLLIEALTEELAKAPEADLFIRRGELFRHHQEWAKAGADFESAARLEPKLEVVDFFRARLLLEAGEPAKAQPFIERYLANVPTEAEGWFLRGDVLGALGKHDDGAMDYAEGIRRAPHPRPEHFLRRARFLAAAPGSDPARVLAALDEGIAKLGPVISLLESAISLELERKNYDAALVRIATAMDHSPRRETWLVRQADVLLKSGRTTEAVAAYRAALAAIEDLPPRYRETVPVEKLERDARTSLRRLSQLTTDEC
jgi:predicted Zn-dependent protease